MAIKILIDSAADINKAEAERLGIGLVSMGVRIGDEEYLDGDTLTARDFYEKLSKTSAFPATSQVNPYTFEEKYKEMTEDGDELIVITISSRLSGTYLSACQAAENFKGKVYVVDSLNATVGQRLLTQYAMQLISKGLSAGDVAAKLNEAKKKIQVMGVLNTLTYLKKGGRISATVAFAGNLFSIKPVVAVVEGEVKLIGKAVGNKKANAFMNSCAEEKGIDFDMPYGVLYTGLDEGIAKGYIADGMPLSKGDNEVPYYLVGSTIGTHLGPGAVGLAFFSK